MFVLLTIAPYYCKQTLPWTILVLTNYFDDNWLWNANTTPRFAHQYGVGKLMIILFSCLKFKRTSFRLGCKLRFTIKNDNLEEAMILKNMIEK
jgi:hypothetical protein